MQINCISFCELLHLFTGNVRRDSETLKVAKKSAGFNDVSRLYLGSNFCSRYFLKFVEIALDGVAKTLKDECGALKVTLCVPVFSQSYLDGAKKLIISILEKHADMIDEITVNDFGMLEFATKLNNVKVNVGRMMNKDTRDIRYAEYFNTSHKPEVFTLTNSLFKNYAVNTYEFDLTNRFVDFRGVNEEYAVYYPFTYATIGNICEYAGVSLPIEKKFRANYHCAYDCVRFLNAYRTREGDEYVKIGKTTYFKVDDFIIKSDKPYRLIYEPFLAFQTEGKK